MADVSSQGEVITCSYDKGLEPGWQIPPSKDDGYLELKLFDTNGQLKWSQALKRRFSMQMHAYPEPECLQVFIQNHKRHAYFYLSMEQSETLLSLDMEQPGTLAASPIDLGIADEKTSVRNIHFHSIQHSNLILAEIIGRVYEDNADGEGSYGYLADALFYLFDNSGQIVWQKQLLGSLDIRYAQGELNEKKVYLKKHNLLTLDQDNQQFSIIDFKNKKQHNYQISVQNSVGFIDTEPFHFQTFSFTKATEETELPRLTQTIPLHQSSKDNPCEHRYSSIDTLSDGTLLLFNQDNFSLSILPSLTEPANIIQLDKSLKLDDYISGEAMFVGQNNQLHINLDQANFALFNKNGDLQTTTDLDKTCQEYCNNDYVAQKNSPLYWKETYKQGFSLIDTDNQIIKTANRDSNGQWIDYIYTMKSDAQGRLLALGRTQDTFNKLYLFDANGQALTTIDLGYSYSEDATIMNDRIYLSQQRSNEILQFNLAGELTGIIPTPNQAYQLHATKKYLFAVTDQAILVYAQTAAD